MSGKLGPYELNSIVHGDCLEVMPLLPDRSVDILLSDWPYGTTACEWDSIIPLEPLWEQVKRVIKPGGAIVLTASQPFTTILIASSPYFGTNKQWFKYEWVWNKVSKTDVMNAKNKPLKQHENILVFSPGTTANGSNRRMRYNPIGVMEGTRKTLQTDTNGGEAMNPRRKSHTLGYYRDQGANYPSSIISISNADRSNPLHPTQKPIALFSYLIRTYSNPGDLILDNCAGSCTTAIAAIDTGRNWLCIEKYPLPGQPISKTNPDYVGIGRERVRERLAQPFLPGVVETALPQPVQLDLGVNDG